MTLLIYYVLPKLLKLAKYDHCLECGSALSVIRSIKVQNMLSSLTFAVSVGLHIILVYMDFLY